MRVTPQEIADLVGMQLGIPRLDINDRMMEDLGAESVDILNIIAAVEDRYRIRIEEEEIPDIRTIHDLFERVSQGARPKTA